MSGHLNAINSWGGWGRGRSERGAKAEHKWVITDSLDRMRVKAARAQWLRNAKVQTAQGLSWHRILLLLS